VKGESFARCRWWKCRRMTQRRLSRLQEKLNFREQLLRLLLLFRCFARPDQFADIARMFPVKRFGQGFRQWRVARIGDHHPHPGDGLQKRPMRSKHKNEHGDHNALGQTGTHGLKLESDPPLSNPIFPFQAIFAFHALAMQHIVSGGHRTIIALCITVELVFSKFASRESACANINLYGRT